MNDTSDSLARAHAYAGQWLATLNRRPVPPQASIEDLVAAFGPDLPPGPCPPGDTIDLMARAGEAGLTAMPSGRFFGFVIGGTHPAGLAADWLVSAWDQNAGLRLVTPTCSALEDIASAWLLDLLGLPADQRRRLRDRGDDVQLHLSGGRPARHAAPGGLGRRRATDCAARRASGCWSARSGTTPSTWRCATWAWAPRRRSRPTSRAGSGSDALRAALEAGEASGGPRPVVLALQAGNVHSGAFDPFAEAIEVAHRYGAWVHIDGAFGLFAGASDQHRHLVDGLRRSRLVDHRRPQDPQRPLRLRDRHRPRPRARSGRRWGCTATT